MKSRGKRKHKSRVKGERGELLAQLVEIQRGLCSGCGKPFNTHDRLGPDGPSKDHTMPIGLGGLNGKGNLTAMHRLCNEMKGNDWPTGCELVWLAAVNCGLGIAEPLDMALYDPQKRRN